MILFFSDYWWWIQDNVYPPCITHKAVLFCFSCLFHPSSIIKKLSSCFHPSVTLTDMVLCTGLFINYECHIGKKLSETSPPDVTTGNFSQASGCLKHFSSTSEEGHCSSFLLGKQLTLCSIHWWWHTSNLVMFVKNTVSLLSLLSSGESQDV